MTRAETVDVADQPDPGLRLAEHADAPAMLRIIAAAFAARPPIDPPADALSDTLADIEARLGDQIGVICSEDGTDVACLFVSFDPAAEVPTAMLHRVSVLPGRRRQGLAHEMVMTAAALAADAGMRRLRLVARRELPQLIEWWSGHGFEITGELDDHRYWLATWLPARIAAPTAAAMQELGRRLAELLRPGDVVVVNGELGAGKTTLAQGLAQGMGVAGQVTSPTFVLSRIHRPRGTGPALVHVDAYRLGSAAELDDLDLDASLADSVTLVEWGAGVAEGLSSDRLEIDIERSADPGDETRIVWLRGRGPRWSPEALWQFVDELGEL